MTNIRDTYLDYAATTPVDPLVVAKMTQCLALEQGWFANPASQHSFGLKAHELITEARLQVANLIHAVPRNIIFTSGATESINLAIKGVALYYQDRGKHIVTSSAEHSAVLASCQYLETLGFTVTYLKPKATGLIDIEALKAAIRDDTILVALMQVNNETGVMQDLKEIGEWLRARNIFFHVDAAQSLGKIAVNVQQIPLDLLSMSSHKLYGPKGIGALYVGDNPRVRLSSQMHGGSQERKFRAGTLATHQIVGFGEACRLALAEISDPNRNEYLRLEKLRDFLWQGLQELPEVVLNSELKHSVPHILNIQFKAVTKGDFLKSLNSKGLAVSAASACHETHLDPSHVLQAMGYTKEDAKRSIRFSIGRFSTQADVEYAIQVIREQYL